MDNIYYMNSPNSRMKIIPAAGAMPVPGSFLSRLSALSLPGRFCACGKLQGNLPGEGSSSDWLFPEEEYFPFDADSFEER